MLKGEQSLQWTAILLNLMVHSVMYFYYAMVALKIKMPFKKIITILQIIQFILGVHYGTYNIIYDSQCHGSLIGAYYGVFVLFSYLALFIHFYVNTYLIKKDKNKTK